MKKVRKRHGGVPTRVPPDRSQPFVKLPPPIRTHVVKLPDRNPIKPVKATKHKKLHVPRSRNASNSNISEDVGYEFYTASSYNDSNGFSDSSHSNGYLNIGTNVRIGSVNPFWKDQTRAGVNATTPLSGYSVSATRSYWAAYNIGSAVYQSTGQLFKSWDYQSSGFLEYEKPTPGSAPPDVVTDVSNRCIKKFLREVSEAQSSDNLTGRSIKHFKHDLHSTLHPMAGIQQKTSDYLTKLEKVPYGKLKGASLYSVITQAYLEYKFGVEPFVDDITAIFTDMVIKDRKRNPSVPVQATASARYDGNSRMIPMFGDPGFMTIYQPSQYRLITSTYSERIRGAVRTGINDDGRIGFIQDNKLLPKDWLPTAFSILPYAWMVNYFTNLNDIIDAASYRFSDTVWGCRTTRDVTTYQYSDVFMANPDTYGVYPYLVSNFANVSTGGNATLECKLFNRSILNPSDLVPKFTFSIPKSPTPWVNMMAAFSPRIFKVVGKLFS